MASKQSQRLQEDKVLDGQNQQDLPCYSERSPSRIRSKKVCLILVLLLSIFSLLLFGPFMFQVACFSRRKLYVESDAGQMNCPQISEQPNQAVFVLASGRSGSTTTLFMLNEIPGFALRGENGGTLYRTLDNSFLNLLDRERVVLTHQDAAWIHADHMNMQCMLTALRDLVIGFLNPPVQATTIGFKELASTIISDQGEIIGADTMAKLFPGAKFILNYRRNESNWLASEFWKEKDKDLYKRTVDGMLRFRERNPNTFILHTEDMNVGKFNEMLGWLGVDNCKYTSVLQLNKGGYSANDGQEVKEQVILCD